MEENDRIRLEAANLLLDRGMRFTITDAPVLLKLLRLNRFRIKPLRAGTIIAITSIISRDHLEDVKTDADANKKLDSISEVVAVAMLNNQRRIEENTESLKQFLLWRVPAATLFKVYLIISKVDSISDFTTITRYFIERARMMMNPKFLGQEKMGS
ncbi:hypothetical protein LJC38_00085 [Parabacteroides sp. OttesenSCG-928-K15]|nr:hypothetical protein [Parabacteroides sp. OttesenSCG-928-K15]